MVKQKTPFLLGCIGYGVVATILSMPGSYLQHKTSPLFNQPRVELPSLAIFYHILVPYGSDEANLVKETIRGQLLDLFHGLSNSPDSPAATVYYTVVGQELEEGFISRICGYFPKQISSCILLQHMESGLEEHTMQSLHEYCQNHQDDRVIYLHMNGSNQASEWQDDWRRHLTQAVVSPECLVRAVNEQCDVCGLLFLAQPSYNFVGNIFNSQCSYIRRLIPPMEYGGRMDNLIDAAKEMFENGTLAFNGPGWALDPWIMGTGQFALEHWLGSHPSLERVCDLAKRREKEYWKTLPVEAREPEDWDLQRFPRDALWCPATDVELPDYCNIDFLERSKVYHLLPGRIFKWDFLYGEVPDPSSLTWFVYPDGQF